jgi:Zn-dependent peptidase ImmA (M78 family)
MKIQDAVNIARKTFEIEGYPGNLFSHIEKKELADKNRIVLFKEDIDKLSGFIWYSSDEVAAICVNYRRPIGHQNFTLAHEIGHWIMHKGTNISDGSKIESMWGQRNTIEHEANSFARELLYPEIYCVEDFEKANRERLFDKDNRKELGVFINELCVKYTISFDFALRRLLYKNKQVSILRTVRKEIEEALGGKVSEIFDCDFYKVNLELDAYQRYLKPYKMLEEKVNYLVKNKAIGNATGESILFRNGVNV